MVKEIKPEAMSKSVIDLKGTIRSSFHKNYMKADGEYRENGEESLAGWLSRECLSVYAEMYDEIKRGYAEGTREIWVPDDAKIGSFRRVTEEEEIAALDDAFDFFASGIEGFVQAKNATDKLREEITATREAMAHQKQSRKMKEVEPEEIIERIYEKLSHARQLFKQAYTINMSDMTGKVNEIFQLSFSFIK